MDRAEAAGDGAVRLFGLMGQRRFLPYFLVQFFGAFNDNIFKIGITLWVTYGLAETLEDTERKLLVTVVSAIFIVPFLLFSAFAGQFADKYRKVPAVRVLKWTELAVMLIGSCGLLFGSLPLLLICLFLMGAQSAAFGPLKYSILPESLGKEELLLGNGWVQAGTFGAILLGTLVGGVLFELPGGMGWLAGGVLVCALAGVLASRGMPDHLPATAPETRIRWNPWIAVSGAFRDALGFRDLRIAILGVGWFWLMGSAVLAQFPIVARDYLGGTAMVGTLLLAMMTVGIAISSPLCSIVLRGKVRFVSVLAGGLAIALSLAAAAWSLSAGGRYPEEILRGLGGVWGDPEATRSFVLIALLALSSGFFTVPLYTWIQQRADPGHRARVVGASNFVNALCMVVAQLFFIGGYALGATLPQLFAVLAFGQVIVTCLIYKYSPDE